MGRYLHRARGTPCVSRWRPCLLFQRDGKGMREQEEEGRGEVMRGVAEREEGRWRRVSWWRRGLENKPFAQQNVVNCLCMGSLVGQLAPVAAGMVRLRRCNTSAWHDRRLLGFAGRCLLFQRGRVGFLNDHPKLRGPTQQIVSPPAGHGRFHELQCCGALRQGGAGARGKVMRGVPERGEGGWRRVSGSVHFY